VVGASTTLVMTRFVHPRGVCRSDHQTQYAHPWCIISRPRNFPLLVILVDHQHSMNMVHPIAGDFSPVGYG
jgi:hypothetical protein